MGFLAPLCGQGVRGSEGRTLSGRLAVGRAVAATAKVHTLAAMCAIYGAFQNMCWPAHSCPHARIGVGRCVDRACIVSVVLSGMCVAFPLSYRRHLLMLVCLP